MEKLLLDFMRFVLTYMQKHGDVQACDAASVLLARLAAEEESRASASFIGEELTTQSYRQQRIDREFSPSEVARGTEVP